MGFGDALAGAGSGAASGAMAGPWGALIGAGIGLFGGLFGAHMQAKSADKAAQIQSASAKYQADLMAKANADAMAFQKSQAENAFLNSEAARQGNYGIFHAREGRLGTLGEEVGMGPRDIPAYVPGVDPMFGGGGSPAGAPAGAPAAAGGAIPPPPKDLQTAIAAANQLAYGGRNKHDDPQYWAAMWQKDPGYTWERLLGKGAGGADVAVAGPFAGRSAAPSSASGGMFGGAAPYVTPMPFMQPTMAPGVRPIGMFG